MRRFKTLKRCRAESQRVVQHDYAESVLEIENMHDQMDCLDHCDEELSVRFVCDSPSIEHDHALLQIP
jgi:hypothetical protein